MFIHTNEGSSNTTSESIRREPRNSLLDVYPGLAVTGRRYQGHSRVHRVRHGETRWWPYRGDGKLRSCVLALLVFLTMSYSLSFCLLLIADSYSCSVLQSSVVGSVSGATIAIVRVTIQAHIHTHADRDTRKGRIGHRVHYAGHYQAVQFHVYARVSNFDLLL